MTSTPQTTTDTAIEYALMIDWEDGQPVEYIPAKSFEHAERMAATIYAGRECMWTVGREAQPEFWPAPWRYARRSDAYLTETVAR